MQYTSTNTIYLGIGEIYISNKPCEIWTVLGSCVSIILFHRQSKIGAICHAVLPNQFNSDKCVDNCPVACNSHHPETEHKYVTCSLKHMINFFVTKGIHPKDLEAKLYGGADMFQFKMNNKSVGERNIEMARESLKQYNVPCLEEEVGGNMGRKVTFNLISGKVKVEYPSRFDK